MATFKVPELDLTQFPIPTQPFIDGKVVDSTADEKHTLISSVNDAVITRGQWQGSLRQLSGNVPRKLTAYLRAPVVKRARCRYRSRSRRARLQGLERPEQGESTTNSSVPIEKDDKTKPPLL